MLVGHHEALDHSIKEKAKLEIILYGLYNTWIALVSCIIIVKPKYLSFELGNKQAPHNDVPHEGVEHVVPSVTHIFENAD